MCSPVVTHCPPQVLTSTKGASGTTLSRAWDWGPDRILASRPPPTGELAQATGFQVSALKSVFLSRALSIFQCFSYHSQITEKGKGWGGGGRGRAGQIGRWEESAWEKLEAGLPGPRTTPPSLRRVTHTPSPSRADSLFSSKQQAFQDQALS